MSALIYNTVGGGGAGSFLPCRAFRHPQIPVGCGFGEFCGVRAARRVRPRGVSRRIRRVCGGVCGDPLDVFVAELRAVFDVARRAVFRRRRVFRVVGFDCRRRRLGVLIFYLRGCEQSGAFVCQILSKL